MEVSGQLHAPVIITVIIITIIIIVIIIIIIIIIINVIVITIIFWERMYRLIDRFRFSPPKICLIQFPSSSP